MNSAPGPPERNGDGRRRRLGAAVLGIALIVPAVTFGLIAAVDPGRAWIGPVVWFLGSPGWLLVWIGVRLVLGHRPFGREPPGGRGR